MFRKRLEKKNVFLIIICNNNFFLIYLQEDTEKVRLFGERLKKAGRILLFDTVPFVRLEELHVVEKDVANGQVDVVQVFTLHARLKAVLKRGA